MTSSTQLKFFAVLLLSTLYFENSFAQKLNEVYLIEAKTTYSDPFTSLPPDESSVVLPIILKTFEATSRNLQNIISWTTLSEQNVKEFV